MNLSPNVLGCNTRLRALRLVAASALVALSCGAAQPASAQFVGGGSGGFAGGQFPGGQMNPAGPQARPTAGKTLVVTSLADDCGPGTLRSRVAQAADGDTITFGVRGIIVLHSAIAVRKSITIVGPGAPFVTLMHSKAVANNPVRFFDIQPNVRLTLTGSLHIDVTRAPIGGPAGACGTGDTNSPNGPGKRGPAPKEPKPAAPKPAAPKPDETGNAGDGAEDENESPGDAEKEKLVELSQAFADDKNDSITLTFSGALDEKAAAQVSRYRMTVNDVPAIIEGITIRRGSVTLALNAGALERGDVILVICSLLDEEGRPVRGEARIVIK